MQIARVLIASEYTAVRELLAQVVRSEPGVVVSGEASNAFQATALAREASPDIALIDLYLPYAVGLDAVRLSRIGGLDTVQAITAEAAEVRTVLINNLEAVGWPERRLAGGTATGICTERGGVKRLLSLRQLCLEGMGVSTPIFANIELGQAARRRSKMRKAIYSLAASLVGAWLVAGLVLLVLFLLALSGV